MFMYHCKLETFFYYQFFHNYVYVHANEHANQNARMTSFKPVLYRFLCRCLTASAMRTLLQNQIQKFYGECGHMTLHYSFSD